MHHTKSLILKESLKLARKKGYQNIKMPEIAAAAEVVNGTVVLHFTNMDKLRRDLVRYAIEVEDLTVIAQAIVSKDRYVRTLTSELKERALSHAIKSN